MDDSNEQQQVQRTSVTEVRYHHGSLVTSPFRLVFPSILFGPTYDKDNNIHRPKISNFHFIVIFDYYDLMVLEVDTIRGELTPSTYLARYGTQSEMTRDSTRDFTRGIQVTSKQHCERPEPKKCFE